MTINLFLRDAPLPETLPRYLKVEGECLQTSSFWGNQNKKVTACFCKFLKEFLKRGDQSEGRMRQVVTLTRQHLTRIGKDATLERYLLATMLRLSGYEEKDLSSYKQMCIQDATSLLNKWKKYELEENKECPLFFTHPDLVDFIFENHLHRKIRYPDYQHHVVMGEDGEPKLLVEGRLTSWNTLKGRLNSDAEGIYTLRDDGTKERWSYLDQGFISHDPTNFAEIRPFKKIEAPLKSQVEVVMTYAHSNKYRLGDLYLHGARHGFFRIIIGQDVLKEEGNILEPGAVYSIGLLGDPHSLSRISPLKNIPQKLSCPDYSEFTEEDLQISTIEVDAQKVTRMFGLLGNKYDRTLSFDMLGKNCCFNLSEFLKQAEVADIPVEIPLRTVLYQCIVPKVLQRWINKVMSWLPTWISNTWNALMNRLFGIAVQPLYVALGSKRGIPQCELETEDAKRPKYFNISSPLKVVEWQRAHGFKYINRV